MSHSLFRPLRAGMLVAAVAAVSVAASAVAAPASLPRLSDPIVPSPVTKVTPYVGRTTLTWTAFDQLSAGMTNPDGAARLNGVSGGAMGIVETGADGLTNEAASWVSADGGVTWTERRVMAETAFGPVVGHGGLLVTTASGFYSSTDGLTWTASATGPHAISMVKLAPGIGPHAFVAFVRDGRSTVTRVWRSATAPVMTWTAVPAQAVVSGFCPSSIATSVTRIVAIGTDCRAPQRARVLVSVNGGRTWTAGAVPWGLRVNTTLTRAPSVSYVGGRFLVTGGNATETATWVWSSLDGRSWRHIASMPRTAMPGWTTDTIVGIFRLGPGYLAIGHRDMPADDAVLVAWRSADLVHWARFSPPVAGCDATVHMVNQAAVIRGQLVAVGNPWSMGSQCAETWMARVTP